MPTVAGKQPLLRLAPQTAPVGAQFFEQSGTEHNVAVLAALALADMNHHPPAISVADLQVSRFCAPCTGSIKRHQKDAMKGGVRGLNQSRDFFLTEHPGKMT